MSILLVSTKITIDKVGKKNIDNNFQFAIVSSGPYKELSKKYGQLKEDQAYEKQIKFNELKKKDEELQKYMAEKVRLDQEKVKLT